MTIGKQANYKDLLWHTGNIGLASCQNQKAKNLKQKRPSKPYPHVRGLMLKQIQLAYYINYISENFRKKFLIFKKFK